MDALAAAPHHAPVRVLPHIKRPDHALGDFLVRVTCPCGTSRHIEPEALARLVGRKVTLAALATRMRCSHCGKKIAEVVAVVRSRPRVGPFLKSSSTRRAYRITVDDDANVTQRADGRARESELHGKSTDSPVYFRQPLRAVLVRGKWSSSEGSTISDISDASHQAASRNFGFVQ